MEDRKFDIIFRIGVMVLLAVVQSMAYGIKQEGDMENLYEVSQNRIEDIDDPNLPDLSRQDLLMLILGSSYTEPEQASTSTWFKRQFGGLLCCNGPPPPKQRKRNSPSHDNRELLKWLMKRIADNEIQLDGNEEDINNSVFPPYPNVFDISSNQASPNLRNPSSMWRNGGRQESNRRTSFWNKRAKVAGLFKRQQIAGVQSTQGGYIPPPPSRKNKRTRVRGNRQRASKM